MAMALVPSCVCESPMGVVPKLGLAAPSDVNLRSSAFLPRQKFVNGAEIRAKGKMRGNVGVRAQAVSVAEEPRVSRMEKWQESKRIQTQSVVIGPETKTIRSLDWDRDRFDM